MRYAEKVVTIDGKDLADFQHLGCRYEGGIREVHRMIGVLLHELEGAVECGLVQEPHRKSTPQDKISEPLRAQTSGIQKMKSFSQHGNGGYEAFPDSLENGVAAIVVLILRIKKGFERPGVNQDHRPCFLRMASRTPRFASAEEAVP